MGSHKGRVTDVLLQVVRNISGVRPQFCNLQMQQSIALRVARKVELSATYVVRQVAACHMSIAICKAVLLK